jgi:hypothetical protein
VPKAAPHPRLDLLASSASPEEAAAVVAALERFMRATAPAANAPGDAPGDAPDMWRRAAILEGLSREYPWELSDPWINP